MNKLIKKLALFLLPFAIAFLWFVAFERCDYWSVKGDAEYLSRSLSSMRTLILKKPTKILLGDSRMANLNGDYIDEVSGEDWLNMAYGGATLNETVQQFWYAAEHNELTEVVIGVDFYNLNDNHKRTSRMDATIQLAENPDQYILNFKHWLDAYYYMKERASNLIADWTGWDSIRMDNDDPASLKQDVRPATELDKNGDRVDLMEYKNHIYNQCVEYSNMDYLYDIEEIIDYCDQNNIKLTFFIMPCHRILWEQVIEPLELQFYIDIYKDRLKSRADVIDMEFNNEYANDDDNFIDGLHLTLEEKLLEARIIFADEPYEYAVRTTKEQYLAQKAALESQDGAA